MSRRMYTLAFRSKREGTGVKRFRLGRTRATLAATMVVLSLTLSSTALAGSGRNGVFNLGVVNSVSGYVTTLTGSLAGRMLQVTNTGTASTAGAIGATNRSSSAATIRAQNTAGGPALEVVVPGGKSPMRVSGGAAKVANLDADKLDGLDQAALQRRVAGACAVGSSIRTISATGTVTCEADNDSAHYVRTVVVSPAGTGVQNGQALLNALSGITGATETNPYVLKIEPGVYDLGTQSLSMKPYVDIEGSGERATKVTAMSGYRGTVQGANNAELRLLTVESVGTGTGHATSIYNDSASPRLILVTATASGATQNTGVDNMNSSPLMTNVTITASGGSNSVGVWNDNSSPVMTNVIATASAGGTSSGVVNIDSSPVIKHSTLKGGAQAITQYGAGTPKVVNSQLDGSRAAGIACFGNYDQNLTAVTCP